MPQIKTVNVVEVVKNEAGWPSRNVLEFIDWLREKLESVPFEFRGKVNMDLYAEYDSKTNTWCPMLTMSYTREMSDYEAACLASLNRYVAAVHTYEKLVEYYAKRFLETDEQG